jgi:hypothetical protein
MALGGFVVEARTPQAARADVPALQGLGHGRRRQWQRACGENAAANADFSCR